MKKLITCFFFILTVLRGHAQSNEITVAVEGFRSDNGRCMVYVFNNKKDYPSKMGNALAKSSGTIANKKCTLHIKGLPAGEYAISVVHDENGNGVMDTGIFGIPKEGVGASNNAKSTIGPPKYDEAKFQFNGISYTANIKLNYL